MNRKQITAIAQSLEDFYEPTNKTYKLITTDVMKQRIHEIYTESKENDDKPIGIFVATHIVVLEHIISEWEKSEIPQSASNHHPSHKPNPY